MDICIRGAGIFGLSIAWACMKAGARVCVVDPNGVASGASGGIVGALAPHVPENWNPKKQFQFESLLMAQDFWSEIEEITGQASGYIRAGRVQPLMDARAVALAKERIAGAQVHWRGEAVWDVVETSEGWPVQSPVGAFIKDTLSAHIQPRQACSVLAEALRQRGVKIYADFEGVVGATIWATGAMGLAEMSQNHTRMVGAGIKGQAILLKADYATLPQLFVDTVHIIPHLDGTIAIGGTTEREYTEPFTTDALLDGVFERALNAVPELRSAEVVERWAGLRPRSRSRAPMLGAWPDRAGHFIANGGFKIGFGMAPKVAQVMARLVLEGHDEIPDGFHVSDNL